MFKLHYQINNDPQVEEEYISYELVGARIIELQEDFTSCSEFSIMVYDTDDNLIQGVNKI